MVWDARMHREELLVREFLGIGRHGCEHLHQVAHAQDDAFVPAICSVYIAVAVTSQR